MKNTRLGWTLGIAFLLAIAIALVVLPSTRNAIFRLAPGEPKGYVHQGKTLDEWIQQLDDTSSSEQVAACLAFQYFPKEKAAIALPKLTPLLRSKHHQVRSAAAYAVGHLGQPARVGIPLLTEALADESADAAEALSLLCGPEDGAAVPALNAALQKASTEVPREFRMHVTRALGKIGSEARLAVPALTALLGAKDAYLRSTASETLGQIGPAAAAAVAPLTAALDDKDGMVRVEAALALWRIEQSAKAVPTLVGIFNDRKNAELRIHAAGALGRIGAGAKAALPVLQDAATTDMTPGVNGRLEVRMAAAAALEKIEFAVAKTEQIGPVDFGGRNAGDERIVTSIALCWCPPSKFMMGSPRTEPERRPGEDQVEVTLTKGFWMAKYESTQGQWKLVMDKLPGELTVELPEGDDFPLGNVNFAEAEAFCHKLTEMSRKSGELPKNWEFRLPTEAQWEYACRAGTTTATSFGDKLSSKQANFAGKSYNGAEPGPSLGRAAKVGSYPANAWGLHDMHGNIYEWCRDWYHAKLPGGIDPDLHSAQSTAARNRTGDISRVRRGGCWSDEGWPCRSAFRLRFEPARRYDHIGFRVVAVIP